MIRRRLFASSQFSNPFKTLSAHCFTVCSGNLLPGYRLATSSTASSNNNNISSSNSNPVIQNTQVPAPAAALSAVDSTTIPPAAAASDNSTATNAAAAATSASTTAAENGGNNQSSGPASTNTTSTATPAQRVYSEGLPVNKTANLSKAGTQKRRASPTRLNKTPRKRSPKSSEAKSPAREFTAEEIAFMLKATDILSSVPLTVKAFDKMDPDTRRYIVVAAASEEWFGTPNVRTQLEAADKQSDDKICATDYEQWIAHSMRMRLARIPRGHYWTLVFFFGAPFFAMGFLDNCVFILAGDVFDQLLWNNFGLSGLLCAGLAGIVSGVVGLQMHGLARRVILRICKVPETTAAQRGSAQYAKAKYWGGVLGLCGGLSAGMMPLLFLGNREAQQQQQQSQTTTTQ